MNKLVFQVEFLSDIVLPASSNTEGNITQLEFIPGSNFLGMVAKNYDKFSNSFDVFHSGKIRFGDATLLKGDEALLKTPFSFFHKKLDDSKIYHHHFLSDVKRKELGQLKQLRSGYIFANSITEVSFEHINYNYAQKSAYDAEKRRSKESSMYGYKAIEAGTKWQFVVQYDADMSDEMELLTSTLLNSKRLGKSKSSQYGAIKIAKSVELNSVALTDINDEVILYAKSRIALVDNEGNATYDLKYLIDGLEDKNILYEKCQIRTSTFTPYNGTMQTKTYERLVIDKGSVIVLKDLSNEQIKALKKGVGVYLVEGFGELIVNPLFLMEEEAMTLIKKSKGNSKKDERVLINIEDLKDETVKFLGIRNNEEIERWTLADDVDKFIEKNKELYKKIKNAQWGTVRSICTSNTENFKDEIRAYVSSGKVEWKENQTNELLKDNHSLEFIKLVAMQMSKEGDK